MSQEIKALGGERLAALLAHTDPSSRKRTLPADESLLLPHATQAKHFPSFPTGHQLPLQAVPQRSLAPPPPTPPRPSPRPPPEKLRSFRTPHPAPCPPPSPGSPGTALVPCWDTASPEAQPSPEGRGQPLSARREPRRPQRPGPSPEPGPPSPGPPQEGEQQPRCARGGPARPGKGHSGAGRYIWEHTHTYVSIYITHAPPCTCPPLPTRSKLPASGPPGQPLPPAGAPLSAAGPEATGAEPSGNRSATQMGIKKEITGPGEAAAPALPAAHSHYLSNRAAAVPCRPPRFASPQGRWGARTMAPAGGRGRRAAPRLSQKSLSLSSGPLRLRRGRRRG